MSRAGRTKQCRAVYRRFRRINNRFNSDAVLETARSRGFECLVWAFDNAERVKKRPPPRSDALQQAMIELKSITGKG